MAMSGTDSMQYSSQVTVNPYQNHLHSILDEGFNELLKSK